MGSSIRQGPNVACNTLADIARDEKVKVIQRVLQKDGQWFKVLLDRPGVSSEGWIYGELLEAVVDRKIIPEPVTIASNDSNTQDNSKNTNCLLYTSPSPRD